jgi:hypothetical protein
MGAKRELGVQEYEAAVNDEKTYAELSSDYATKVISVMSGLYSDLKIFNYFNFVSSWEKVNS